PRNELAPLLDGTSGIVRVSPLIDREAVVDRVEPGTPGEVLRQLVAPLVRRGIVGDADQYVRQLLAREQLSSTALGHGVAVPHVRRPSENPEGAPAVLLGLCRAGTDFGAFDGRPVHLFFLLGATSEAIHLRLLKRITLMFRDPDVLDALLAGETARDLVDTFASAEDRLFPGG
ncbi:MAG: PTS sugar transporter subunit IIA, partial [Spirochaetota bacterium]